MKWFTDISIKPRDNQLNHSDAVVLFGSCFASNMFNKLQESGVPSHASAFGVVYNPVSLLLQLGYVFGDSQLEKSGIVKHEALYKSVYFHSSLNAPSEEKLIRRIRDARQSMRSALKEAKVLCLSLGTAWVYEHETFGLVANCQKLPQKRFEKRLLSVEECGIALKKMLELLKDNNPGLEIILTLSPVRHLKDGMPENARSKAILLESIHRCCSKENAVAYFPSYEIQMDVLRDYRFYASDLLHPSEEAIDFIWQKFSKYLFCAEALELMERVLKLSRAQKHRLLNSESELGAEFLQKVNEEIEQLKQVYPYIQL